MVSSSLSEDVVTVVGLGFAMMVLLDTVLPRGPGWIAGPGRRSLADLLRRRVPRRGRG